MIFNFIESVWGQQLPLVQYHTKERKKIEKRERKNGGETFPNNATKEREREREG